MKRVQGGATTYFLLDHLGSTRYTLDNSAAMNSYPPSSDHRNSGKTLRGMYNLIEPVLA